MSHKPSCSLLGQLIIHPAAVLQVASSPVLSLKSPPSSSSLSSVACHSTSMEQRSCACKQACRKPICLLHIQRTCAEPALYFRVYYTHASKCSTLRSVLLCTHRERWTEHVGYWILWKSSGRAVYTHSLACVDVFNSASQEAPSEEATVRALVL